jgi:hypothetical protein
MPVSLIAIEDARHTIGRRSPAPAAPRGGAEWFACTRFQPDPVKGQVLRVGIGCHPQTCGIPTLAAGRLERGIFGVGLGGRIPTGPAAHGSDRQHRDDGGRQDQDHVPVGDPCARVRDHRWVAPLEQETAEGRQHARQGQAPPGIIRIADNVERAKGHALQCRLPLRRCRQNGS